MIKRIGTWTDVLNSARTTVNKSELDKEPSSEFKRRMLLSEHSPIRNLSYRYKWTNIPYWVSVHFTRHKIGIEHFVRTQRSDRAGIDRENLSQSALVEHEFVANAQAIINISRKRLCSKAAKETFNYWVEFLTYLKVHDYELVKACVPECVYRGFCPEFDSCGMVESKGYENLLKSYREGFKWSIT